MEVLCVNDSYSPEWMHYFSRWGIVYPTKDKIYTVRELIPNSTGEKGLLLAEIVNDKTPRISPITGMKGMAEQNFALSRFTTLMQTPVLVEEIVESLTEV